MRKGSSAEIPLLPCERTESEITHCHNLSSVTDSLYHPLKTVQDFYPNFWQFPAIAWNWKAYIWAIVQFLFSLHFTEKWKLPSLEPKLVSSWPLLVSSFLFLRLSDATKPNCILQLELAFDQSAVSKTWRRKKMVSPTTAGGKMPSSLRTLAINTCKDLAITFCIPLKYFLEPSLLFYKLIHPTNIYRFLKDHREAKMLRIIAPALQTLTSHWKRHIGELK